MTDNPRRRVLFIVLDGGDLAYMRPWLEAGELPHIASVVEQGALMPLASTIINFTHVAWPSLFTGKNPGKTGITDITLRKSGSHDLVPATLQGCQAEPFWVFLGEQGLRTLVANVPMTYPPRPLNGMLTCGFDTPEDAQEYAWPKPIRERLDQRGYRSDVLQAQHRLIMLASTHRRKLNKAAYLEACSELTQRTLSHLEYLLAGQEWDVAFVGYHPTDWINHFTADRDAHLRVYQMADSFVGSLIAQAGDDVDVILASDHGSMQAGRCIGLTRLLLDAGLIAFKPKLAPEIFSWIIPSLLPDALSRPALLRAARRIWMALPEWLQYALSWLPLKLYPGWAHYYSNIDWTQTQAYVTNATKTIYINRSDVIPGGIVEPGPEYEALRDRIIDAFESFRDPGGGSQVFRAHRTETIWHGAHLDAAAPDLLLSLVEENAFVQQADPRGRASWVEDEEVIGGTHRSQGILILKGSDIQEGITLPCQDILDVVPTLLHLMSVPLPLELDGKPITSAFKPDFLEKHPIQMASYARPDTYQPDETAYSEEDLESVLEKLRGLGYIE